jgi:hypothetical protein
MGLVDSSGTERTYQPVRPPDPATGHPIPVRPVRKR